jgi:hypothetical protein
MEEIYLEFVDFVLKSGYKEPRFAPDDTTEVYRIDEYYILLSKDAIRAEDIVMCVAKDKNNVLYVSKSVLNGQKLLKKRVFSKHLSDPKILIKLLNKWSKK